MKNNYKWAIARTNPKTNLTHIPSANRNQAPHYSLPTVILHAAFLIASIPIEHNLSMQLHAVITTSFIDLQMFLTLLEKVCPYPKDYD